LGVEGQKAISKYGNPMGVWVHAAWWAHKLFPRRLF
jgi:hypothetical protein